MSISNGVTELEIEGDPVLTEKQQRVVKILKILLADEFVLYTKLRNYYWNVTGMNFDALHAAFQDQFNAIAALGDTAAEHIRQNGVNATGTMSEFMRKTHLFEEPGVYPDSGTMVANIVADHEVIIRFLHKDIASLSGAFGDVGLLTDFLEQHEKLAWMLRLCLGEPAVIGRMDN
jgi:starvation-inducible DNA-binding protein